MPAPGWPRPDTVGTVPTGGEAFTENQEEHWRTPGSRGVCLHPGPRPLTAAEHWGVGHGVMLGSQLTWKALCAQVTGGTRGVVRSGPQPHPRWGLPCRPDFGQGAGDSLKNSPSLVLPDSLRPGGSPRPAEVSGFLGMGAAPGDPWAWGAAPGTLTVPLQRGRLLGQEAQAPAPPGEEAHGLLADQLRATCGAGGDLHTCAPRPSCPSCSRGSAGMRPQAERAMARRRVPGGTGASPGGGPLSLAPDPGTMCFPHSVAVAGREFVGGPGVSSTYCIAPGAEGLVLELQLGEDDGVVPEVGAQHPAV